MNDEYVHQIDEQEFAAIGRFLRWMAVGVAAFTVAIVAAYLTADRWLMLVSPAAERRFAEPYVNFARQRLLEPADPTLQRYVESLISELSEQTQSEAVREVTVTVVGGDLVNAFATLGSHVFVFEGLIREVDNENALVMVLAHELAHVEHRHALRSTGRVLLLQLAIATITGTNVDPQGLDFGAELALTSHSRRQELAADELAVRWLQQHYGHVGGATDLFRTMQEQGLDDTTVQFLSTHPYTEDRIERIEALAREQGWSSAPTQPYPQAVRVALGIDAMVD